MDELLSAGLKGHLLRRLIATQRAGPGDDRSCRATVDTDGAETDHDHQEQQPLPNTFQER